MLEHNKQTGCAPRSPLGLGGEETARISCLHPHRRRDRGQSFYPLLPPPPFPCPLTHETLLLGQIRFGLGELTPGASRPWRGAGHRHTSSGDGVEGGGEGGASIREMLGKWTLPEEAIILEPDQSANCDQDESAQERLIFGNSIITEEEQRAIDKVLVALQREGKPWGGGDEEEGDSAWIEQQVLRFLYSSEFDVRKTTDLMRSAVNFRRTRLPVFLHEVGREIRDEGMAYWHGRDRALRPLLIVRVQKMRQLQRPDKDIEEDPMTRAIIFCLEFFLRYLCVAGRVESWTVLCDCEGTSFSSFPLGLVLRLLKLFQASYRGRMHRFYLLNTPRFFQTLSKPLLSALPHSTTKKLRVFGTSREWCEERRRTCARHQLEIKYGGSQPNIEKDFFPFRFFPGPFEPSTTADQVNWQSPPFLHEEVSPLIHTGFSLHASLYCQPNNLAPQSPSEPAAPFESCGARAPVSHVRNSGAASGRCAPSAPAVGRAVEPYNRERSEHTVCVEERYYSRFAFWASAASFLSLTPATAAWLNQKCQDKVQRHHAASECRYRVSSPSLPTCLFFRPSVSLADVRALYVRERAQAELAIDVEQPRKDALVDVKAGNVVAAVPLPVEQAEALGPTLAENKDNPEDWRRRGHDGEGGTREDAQGSGFCIQTEAALHVPEEKVECFSVIDGRDAKHGAISTQQQTDESPAAQGQSRRRELMGQTLFKKPTHMQRGKEGEVEIDPESSRLRVLPDEEPEAAVKPTVMSFAEAGRSKTNPDRAEDGDRNCFASALSHEARATLCPSSDSAASGGESTDVARPFVLSGRWGGEILQDGSQAWVLSSSTVTGCAGGNIFAQHIVMNSLCQLPETCRWLSDEGAVSGNLARSKEGLSQGSLSHQVRHAPLSMSGNNCSTEMTMPKHEQHLERTVTALLYFRRRVRLAVRREATEGCASWSKACSRRRRVVLSPRLANGAGCGFDDFPAYPLGQLSLQQAVRPSNTLGCVEELCICGTQCQFYTSRLTTKAQDREPLATLSPPGVHQSKSSVERPVFFFDRLHGKFEMGRVEDQERRSHMNTVTQSPASVSQSPFSLGHEVKGGGLTPVAESLDFLALGDKDALQTVFAQLSHASESRCAEGTPAEHCLEGAASCRNHEEEATALSCMSTTACLRGQKRYSLGGTDAIPKSEPAIRRPPRGAMWGFPRQGEDSQRRVGHGAAAEANDKTAPLDPCIEVGSTPVCEQRLKSMASFRTATLHVSCSRDQGVAPAAKVMKGGPQAGSSDCRSCDTGFLRTLEEVSFPDPPSWCLSQTGEETLVTQECQGGEKKESDLCPGISVRLCDTMGACDSRVAGSDVCKVLPEEEDTHTTSRTCSTGDATIGANRELLRGDFSVSSQRPTLLRCVRLFRPPTQHGNTIGDTWLSSTLQEPRRLTEVSDPHNFLTENCSRVCTVFNSRDRLRPWIHRHLEAQAAVPKASDTPEVCGDPVPAGPSLGRHSSATPVRCGNQLRQFFVSCLRRSQESQVGQLEKSYSAGSSVKGMSQGGNSSWKWQTVD